MKKIRVGVKQTVGKIEKDCVDVVFLGFHLYQMKSKTTEKWYMYLQPKTELYDPNGELIERTNPEDRRVLLYAGMDEPMSFKDLREKMVDILNTLQKRLITGEINVVGNTPEQVEGKGYDPELIKEIQIKCTK